MTAAVDALCGFLGIDPSYEDAWGRPHTVSDATRLALLAALGHPLPPGAGDDHAALELERLRAVAAARVLPPLLVLEAAPPPWRVHARLPAALLGRTLWWRIWLEDGGERRGSARVAAAGEADGEGDAEGRIDAEIALAVDLPPGYHRLRVFEHAASSQAFAETGLAICPPACEPAPAQRLWGPAVQVYALRSARDWGMGDFGSLRRLVDAAADAGAQFVGVNPLHALFPHDPERASPYSPSSREWLNVLYLDIEAMRDFGECAPARERVGSAAFRARLDALRAPALVDYAGVAAAKFEVLELLYRHFRGMHLDSGTQRAGQFRDFQREGGRSLRLHALFDALQAHFHAQDAAVWGWTCWPAAYRDVDGAAVEAFALDNEQRVEFFEYLQWQAELQLQAVASRARARGMRIGLYRDLAVGVNEGGSETWARPALHAFGAHAGAPPDELNPAGQDWGFPPQIPQRLADDGYAPLLAVLRANMRHAGALRIDHVMSLMRLFWLPAAPAEEGEGQRGAYVAYPMQDLFRLLCLESRRQHCVVIGEDLGIVPATVRAAMARHGLLSYRPLYFEHEGDGFRPPAHWPQAALAVVGTHDLPTLRGYWAGHDLHLRGVLGMYREVELRERQAAQRAHDCRALLAALAAEGLAGDGPAPEPERGATLAPAVYRYIARSPAAMAAVQLEDVLGQLDAANLPGTSETAQPNWRRRLDIELADLAADPRWRAVAGAIEAERPGTPLPVSGGPPDFRAELADVPRATYRLQFNRGFDFAAATAVLPYLAELGISHVYAAPFLKARPGSSHGYDIVDHQAVNPEIGSDADFDRYCARLAGLGLGQVLDVVPNHVGVLGADNAWWLDVLENGPASAFAEHFDIDWEPPFAELRGKVLLPVLGDQYGLVLEAGELALKFDPEQGSFSVHYYEHRFPVDPADYGEILEAGEGEAGLLPPLQGGETGVSASTACRLSNGGAKRRLPGGGGDEVEPEVKGGLLPPLQGGEAGVSASTACRLSNGEAKWRLPGGGGDEVEPEVKGGLLPPLQGEGGGGDGVGSAPTDPIPTLTLPLKGRGQKPGAVGGQTAGLALDASELGAGPGLPPPLQGGETEVSASTACRLSNGEAKRRLPGGGADEIEPEVKGGLLPPLQGEGGGGDGVDPAPQNPIPTLALPLKGRGQNLGAVSGQTAGLALDGPELGAGAGGLTPLKGRGQTGELSALIAAFRLLPPRDTTSPESLATRRRDKETLKHHLADLYARLPELQAQVATALAAYRGRVGEPETFDPLDRLLSRQAYRLASWRVAADDINYRRFFDVNDLAALRMENDAVFEATHARILRWIAEGRVSGLRIDHPDGLADPAAYFERLQARQAASAGKATQRPLYLVVEKILGEFEALPAEWPVHGATGYRFASLCDRLFVDPAQESRLTRIYRAFSGEARNFGEVLLEAKHLIMTHSLPGELGSLAYLLYDIAQHDRCTRDFTRSRLRGALAEVVAAFPVYRSYIGERGVSAADRRHVERAVEEAMTRGVAGDASVLRFVGAVLLSAPSEPRAALRRLKLRFVRRFQQFTAPVMAKAMEDTALYRYCRLVSLNDVGGDPRSFGIGVEDFHLANEAIAGVHPFGLLASSTHDSKRSEDVRARIDVISEMPGPWRLALRRWRRLNARGKQRVNDAPAPSANDEYLLYQTLLGVWPFAPCDAAALAALAERVDAYMLKAAREAKRHTSWINPEPGYEAALAAFVRRLFAADGAFLADFLPFQAVVARFGVFNSLNMLLLKLTAPGVPDIYQGCEGWNLSLVDPDNRRAVDFAAAADRLHALQQEFAIAEAAIDRLRALLAAPQDGRIKHYLLWRGLAARCRFEQTLRGGRYVPLEVEGPAARHVVAYARVSGDEHVVVIATRLLFGLCGGDPARVCAPELWAGTVVALPWAGQGWEDLLSGRRVGAVRSGRHPGLALSTVFDPLPFALLVPDERSG